MKTIDDLGFEKKEPPPQNRLSDEEVWLRIYCAMISSPYTATLSYIEISEETNYAASQFHRVFRK
jgi:hypothetical protein